MGKIFSDNKITVEGKVLSLEECKLFFDFKYQSFDKTKIDLVIKEAEGYLEESIPFLPLSYYREFWKSGSRSKYQSPYYKRRDMLFPMIFAEYYENEGRFTDKIADLIWAILEESSWVIHAHSSHTPTNFGSTVPTVYKEADIHGVDLFSAMTAAMLATALVYLRDKLTAISPLLVERLEYEIEKRSITPFLSYIFTWSGSYGSRPNNWCPWITSNILYITAIMEKDQRKRVAVVNRALKYVDNYIGGQPDDGGCDEGPGYWSAAGGSLFDCLELIYDMTGGAVNVYDYPQLRKIGEYEPFVNISGNRYVNFGDTSSRMVPNGYMIERFGEAVKSDMLIAFAKSIQSSCAQVTGNRHVYRYIKDLMMPMHEGEAVTKSPTKGYLPDLKLMIARESEDTSKGFYVACKGGHNKQSHNHNDVGQFIVYYNGEPVIIDAGTVRYTKDTFGPKRYTIWAMQSEYHNLPTFNGVGEKNGIEYASSREVYDEVTGKITYGLENAYPKAANLESYTRSAELKDGAVIISEDIVQTVEQEIDFHILLHREPTPIEKGKLLIAEGRTLIYDDRLELEIEEFDPVGADTMKGWETEVLWRLHFRITAKDFACEFKVM